MSDLAGFVSTRRPNGDADLDAVVAKALLREANERLTRGDRMLAGDWYDPQTFPQVFADQWRQSRQGAFEFLALMALVGMLGLAFVGLAVLLA